MFNFFKKESTISKLQKKYKKLLTEAYDISKINRSASDAKVAEANAILKNIEILLNQQKA